METCTILRENRPEDYQEGDEFGLSAEERLLLLILASDHCPDSLDTVREVFRGPLDYNRFIGLATWHGVLPLVFARLVRTCSQDVPERTMAQMRRLVVYQAAQSYYLTQKLVELLGTMEKFQIPVMPLKGPVLAHDLYGDIRFRQFGDIDVLVRREDLERTVALVAAMGYRLVDRANTRASLAVEGQRHVRAVSPDGRTNLEVHWEPGWYPFISPKFSAQAMWGRARLALFRGRPIMVPHREDSFLFLCLHGAVHRWNRLAWVCDVRDFLYCGPPLDWHSLNGRALDLGCSRALALAMTVVKDLLGTPLPPECSTTDGTLLGMESMISDVRKQLKQSPDGKKDLLKDLFFHLKFVDGRRNQILYILFRAASPMPVQNIMKMPFGKSFREFMVRSVRRMLAILFTLLDWYPSSLAELLQKRH